MSDLLEPQIYIKKLEHIKEYKKEIKLLKVNISYYEKLLLIIYKDNKAKKEVQKEINNYKRHLEYLEFSLLYKLQIIIKE